MARSNPFFSPLYLSLLLILISVSAGCSGGSGGPVYPDDLYEDEGVSRFIRADLGGSIEAPGATIHIPPGALPADTDITIKHIGPGKHIGGKAIAGGVEIFPHLVDLNGPVLIEFPVVPGVFRAWSFPQGYYWSEGTFVPLYFRDGTPSHALISGDGDSAMLSSDHFSAFVLLMDQENESIDNTDVVLSSLEKIQLRNDIAFFYDDDILIDNRMKYYIGGWPQVYGSESWLPELFDFAHPGEVNSPSLRYEIYREIFGDLLVMNSFARSHNERDEEGFPCRMIMPSLIMLFQQLKADQALQDSWVNIGGTNDYFDVMNSSDIFDGYTFVEYMVESEKRRYTAVSNAIEVAIADGNIPDYLGQYLQTNGLKLRGLLDDEFNFFMRLSADWAIAQMNCDSLESLCDRHVFIDPAAETAARDCIGETRLMLDRAHVKFASAVSGYLILNPDTVIGNDGIHLFEALVFIHEAGGFRNICTPLSYGAVYPYFINNGQPEMKASSIAYHAASIKADAVTYGLEKYLNDDYSWDPIVFVRNLQRATLAGNLAGELLTQELIAALDGQSGVASDLGFAEIMRANLGYIYSRLKYNAWAYVVKSDNADSYEWLGELSPWQTNNFVMEFDSVKGRHFRTESNRHLNENIYCDIVWMLEHLIIPKPVIESESGLEIIIQ